MSDVRSQWRACTRSFALVLGVLGCGPEVDEDAFEQEVANACNPACFVDNECTDRAIGECVPTCYDGIEHRMPPRPPCDTARLELAECQGTLNCDEFEALQNGEPNPCSAEADEVEALCD